MTLGQRYANAMEQLLPRGWAWQKRGCDDSLLGRLFLAEGEELARFHVWFEQQVKASIERFSVFNQGWSAPEYEQLLQDRFGIDAEVTDGLMPMTCEDHCEHALLDHTVVYIYVITVDDVSAIPEAVKDYLREYQQSHTHFWFRDRQLKHEYEATHQATHCQSIYTLGPEGDWPHVPWYVEDLGKEVHYHDGFADAAHCESPLYEQDYGVIELIADWTWRDDELPGLDGWDAVEQLLTQQNTLFAARRGTHASH